jgi:hypothetical protein
MHSHQVESDVIDKSELRWTLSQAAQIAGYAKLNTLRSYFQRGWFRIVGGEAAKSRGSAGLLTLHDVLAVGVARPLIEAGAEPRLAFEAGLVFAHFGEDGRDPGGTFDLVKCGFTVMVFFPSDGACRILATKDALHFNDLFVHPRTGARETGLHLLLNDVEKSVLFGAEALAAQR